MWRASQKIFRVVPTTTGGYAAGDQLLFFGIERAATEGDGNMGFWFLQDGSVDCEKMSSGKAPAFTGNHVDGDIFAVAGFSNGGTQATVTAYRWNGGAGGSLSATPFVSANEVCGTGTSHDACGIVNTAEIATGAGKPWPSPDKNGGDLDVNAFYEGFVRIPVANAAAGCFATFVANTRSSTSPTATIHDFSRGSFPTCQPSTELTATPTTGSPEVVVAGDSVTYSFSEKNDGNVTLTERATAIFVSQSARASELLTALLRMAKLDLGEAPQRVPADLEAICRSEVQRASQLSPQLEIELHSEAGPASPIELDPASMREVVTNLMDNARRHAVRRIDVRIAVVGDDIELAVHDDGAGMDADTAQRAFGRFVSFDSCGGTGLGCPSPVPSSRRTAAPWSTRTSAS